MTDYEKYVIARWAYSIGKEFISDVEYNALHNVMLKSPVGHRLAQQSWSKDYCPVSLLKKYGYLDWIYDIIPNGDKSESIPSITSIYQAEEVLKQFNTDIFISTKEDGFNGQCHYCEGKRTIINSRGRSADALTYWNFIDKLPIAIPLKDYTRIYGEIVLTNEGFELLSKATGARSQRSSVSTALANPKYTKYLEYHAFYIENKNTKFRTMEEMYKTLQSFGFKTPQYIIVPNGSNVLEAFKEFSKIRYTLNHLTDGGVIQSNQFPYDNKYAFRIFEWKEPYYKSYIKSYEYSRATHNYGIKLAIYPIHVGVNNGNIQRLLDIDNLNRIIKYRLFPDSPVVFTLTSHADPNIDLELTRLLQEEVTDIDAYKYQIEQEEETILNYERMLNTYG